MAAVVKVAAATEEEVKVEVAREAARAAAKMAAALMEVAVMAA